MSDEIVVDKDTDFREIPVRRPDWSRNPSIDNLYSPGYIITMDETGQMSDYHTLVECERAMDKCRIAIFELSERLDKAERVCHEAQVLYKRKHNRAYLAAVASTESRRNAIADVMTERYENEVILREQYVKELNRRLRNLFTEMDALKNLAWSIRKEMSVQ